MKEEKVKYSHRYIARIVLEATTALFVGSGESSLLNDALVQKDHHGFPMIQGSSLAGVLQHLLKKNTPNMDWDTFFGYQKQEKGLGSKAKISSAYLLLNDGKIAEGLENDFSELLPYFNQLPSRPHVRITHRGTAADQAFYENEVVYKGCRFIFELELKGDGSDTEKAQWKELLQQLGNPLFRLGQGTRNGYGKLKVVNCKERTFNLTNKDQVDFNAYLDFPCSFNAATNALKALEIEELPEKNGLQYQLKLKPDSFFIFSSGTADELVDAQPAQEQIVQYIDKQLKLEEQSLIPASSIKGAIRHRTCFHYNRSENRFAEKHMTDKDLEKWDSLNTPALQKLFGRASEEEKGLRGKVIINDLHYKKILNEKVFNHVAIDRFTGGAMSGALFSEKVSQLDFLNLDIWLEDRSTFCAPLIKAFENTLIDICKGLLPLGGMNTKGHGIFTGVLFKNEEEIYDYDKKI